MAFINEPTTSSLESQWDNRARAMKVTFRDLTSFTQSMWLWVWRNADGHTPQEMFTAMGTSAAEAIRLSDLTGQYLANVAQVDYVSPVPQGVTITANEDGTVTVTSA